jgi:signal peptidase I
MTKNPSTARRWLNTAAEIAAIVLVITVAKAAIAEPYYVPSGSMEPTLLIGDELLATKFPYGYSSASLPLGISLPRTQRILGAMPERGDVVVFRHPGQSQSGLGQARDRPAGRTRADARRAAVDQRRAGPAEARWNSIHRRAGRAAAFGDALHRDAAGRPHASDPEDERHQLHRRHAGNRRAGGSRVRHGRQSRQLGRQPHSRAEGGVGLLPVSDLIGRVESIVGSFDLNAMNQPIWTWPSGLRFARFFTAIK